MERGRTTLALLSRVINSIIDIAPFLQELRKTTTKTKSQGLGRETFQGFRFFLDNKCQRCEEFGIKTV